jgi:hypothetical protein
MSLLDLIGEADTRGLAASGLACLDRCVPLLGGGDEALRPLWACLAGDAGEAARWAELVAEVRAGLPGADGAFASPDADPADPADPDPAVAAARWMLDAMPDTWDGDALRAWAEGCSLAALRVHRLLDPSTPAGDLSAPVGDPSAPAGGTDPVAAYREGRGEGAAPLVAAELRRQSAVLELVAEHGAAGLRPALEICTEGRRVLRAVVSRRARGRRVAR